MVVVTCCRPACISSLGVFRFVRPILNLCIQWYPLVASCPIQVFLIISPLGVAHHPSGNMGLGLIWQHGTGAWSPSMCLSQCHKHPSAPSPSHHHFNRWYGYHPKWVVYDCISHAQKNDKESFVPMTWSTANHPKASQAWESSLRLRLGYPNNPAVFLGNTIPNIELPKMRLQNEYVHLRFSHEKKPTIGPDFFSGGLSPRLRRPGQARRCLSSLSQSPAKMSRCFWDGSNHLGKLEQFIIIH